jgi:hypothetical protein
MQSILTALLLICVSAAAAAPAPDVGAVSFANSGAPAAQNEFTLGLAQLHNFEYDDSATHFKAAQAIDPGFAMAYWGEAMTKNHGIWHEQDLTAARAVLARLGPTPEARRAKAATEREKAYFDAVEILYGDGSKEERDSKYMQAMARVHQQYPNDVDATAFYALSILSSAEQGRDFAIYMRAAAVLEEVFPQHPRHPGVVHYLIHSYDDPIHAPLGLRAARIYAQIAPAAGHAQHMTSHIFLALGMWDEVVKANETAIAVVNDQRKLAGKPPRYCGHYGEWLEYGYLQLDRLADARRVLEDCREEAVQRAQRMPSDSSSADSYAEMRAHFLINSELWKDEVARSILPIGDFPMAHLTVDYTDALAAYNTGQFSTARDALARAEVDAKAALAWLDREHIDDPGLRTDIALLIDQLRALLSASKPDDAETISALQRVALAENSLPLEFGPPPIFKPTDELLGDIYLRAHRPADARKAYAAALARAPGRRLAIRGLAKAEQ